MQKCLSQGESKEAKSNVSFFHVFSLGLQPEGAPTFRVGLSTSNNLIKKIPHESVR